jgi:hypothetical protein
VVVVTQAWHMPRSVWSFEKAGFEVVPAPVGFLGRDNARPLGGWMPEFKSIWQSGQLINEAVGQSGLPVVLPLKPELTGLLRRRRGLPCCCVAASSVGCDTGAWLADGLGNAAGYQGPANQHHTQDDQRPRTPLQVRREVVHRHHFAVENPLLELRDLRRDLPVTG